jgi:hypothetical protein
MVARRRVIPSSLGIRHSSSILRFTRLPIARQRY